MDHQIGEMAGFRVSLRTFDLAGMPSFSFLIDDGIVAASPEERRGEELAP